jgi:hypothetical protein
MGLLGVGVERRFVAKSEKRRSEPTKSCTNVDVDDDDVLGEKHQERYTISLSFLIKYI